MELDSQEEIRNLFASLCEHYNAGSSKRDLLLQSTLLQLVYRLDQQTPLQKIKHSPKHNNRGVIEETIRYVEENLTSDLSLAILSERANFSPVYFHKLFRASTGKTLHDYVENQRIKKSIDLLISSEMNLTQIAYECGFSSQSYVSYAFKRRMKCSPREYAKTILQTYEK
jgi:AraC-like DNA-binding protein